MSKKKQGFKVKEHQLYTVRPGVWKKLKKQNIIDNVYRFRARKIELVHRIFIPAASLQWTLYAKKIKRISFDKHPPVFILGLWRSGTTHLHYAMARDDQFAYLNNHQAFTFNFSLLTFNKLNKLLNIFIPKRRPQDNVKLTLDEPAEEEQPLCTMTTRSSIHSFFFPKNQQYFRKYHLFENIEPKEKEIWGKKYMFLLQNIAFYSKKNRLLLKNPHNTGRIKELLELFPDAKFIFLHRDPYKVFQSTKKLYMRTISSQFLQFMNQRSIENLILENNALILKKYLAERSMIPTGNLVEISYKQLEEAPVETLREIYSELHIPGFKNATENIQIYLDSVRTYRKNKYAKLNKNMVRKINDHWKIWFSEWGYNMLD